MNALSLPDTTHIGYAHLRVADLGRSLAFYRDLLGFQETARDGATVTLSARDAGLAHLILTEHPGAPPKPLRMAGLYHVAIRLPTRQALARVLWRLAQHQYPLQGASDHGVSEALYLADPDGNGLELYADRPRSQWTWDNGQIAMSTDPLDVQDLLALIDRDAFFYTGIDPAADIGHIHLQVSNLVRAEAFYSMLLGLVVMQRSYPGVLFLAAGGYHHHLGLNTWASRGALPAPPDAAGLIAFSLVVPDSGARQNVIARFQGAGIPTTDQPDGGVLVHDPDGSGVILVAAQAPSGA